ncbi:hypothetical protein CD798_13175 [Bacillaceae bacterium SAOS 7]|nr:hypothetical protein CD798_13175 [Bacillaceae bacterium SAOS 7]
MKKEDLIQLRTHQFMVLNITMAVFFLVIFFMSVAGVEKAIFFLLIACVMFFQAGFIYFKKGLSMYFFSAKMRKLMDYEKEKLGSEWSKQYRLHLTLQLLLGIMFLLYTFAYWGTNEEMEFRQHLLSTILIYVCTSIFVNISHFFQVRKIDCSSNRELQGYTSRMIKACGIIFLISTFTSFLIGFLLI